MEERELASMPADMGMTEQTTQTWWWSAVGQLLFGVVAAGATYLSVAIGVNVS